MTDRFGRIVLKNSLEEVRGGVLGVFKPSTHDRSVNVVNSAGPIFLEDSVARASQEFFNTIAEQETVDPLSLNFRLWGPNPFASGKNGNRAEVIQRYCAWLESQPKLVEAARRELAGKNLFCFCHTAACHGDVLLAIANQI